MKPLNEGAKIRLLLNSRHLLAGVAVLLLVILVGWAGNTPIRTIFPYALAVGLVAWKHGMTAGFLFAGLAALAKGAFPSREELSGQEVGEGLYTYFKLSAVAAGVALGKQAKRA
jgi:hypothetical protein